MVMLSRLRSTGHMMLLGSIVAGVAAALAIVVIALLYRPDLERLRQWLEQAGPWTAVVIGAAFIIAGLIMLPCWPLSIIAGALWGPWWGTLLISAVSTFAATIAFLLARHLMRERMLRWLNRYRATRITHTVINRGNWRVIALLRLAPLIPFNVQNYLFGLGRVETWRYVLVTWLTMIPGEFLLVYSGYVARTGLDAIGEPEPIAMHEWIARIGGLIVALVLVLYIAHLTRAALLEAEGEDEGEEDERLAMQGSPAHSTIDG
jgi:uncharacterized membrane protein YdjX (TVP38/TMEM64 family)